MEELTKVDAIRRKSADMRTKGHEALVKLPSERLNNESLYTQYKHARVAWQYSKRDQAAQEHVKRIDDLRREFALTAIQGDYVPVLTAAEAMRAFVSVGRLAISKETMLCWYSVVREIFTAANPDWCIGGARAGDKGWVTAYSTSQCVRALCDLAQALEKTSELLAYMQGVFDHVDGLGHDMIPIAWKQRDAERLVRDMSITIALASNVVVFDLANLSMLLERDDAITVIRTEFRDLVRTALEKLQREIGDVSDQLDRTAGSGALPAESKTGHAIASEAVDTGKELVDRAIHEMSEKRWMEKLAVHFRVAAEGVRQGVSACKGYLSSVIDRQLAASSPSDSRSWEPAELAYAVSAYALALGDDYGSAESDRLKLAAQLVCDDLSADGTIPNRIPFHSDGASQYSVNTDELLGAVADVVRAARWQIGERFVTNVLHYFDRQRMRDNGSIAIRGWAAEFDHYRKEPDISATVDAVESLGAFNRMLDDGINRTILEHFTVRAPEPTGLRLDGLFYPDYGFHGLNRLDTIAELKTAKCKIGRQPIALTMQEMRAHVLRASGLKGLNSLVLHGPGGTGKTTLIEALANTCNVPLVEVTPSDIAMRGEAAIETRARAVFSALSMLSRVVILFDEFDPILKRRDDTGASHTTIFSFLTPGMLPKLKALHDGAKDRAVAFALITNLIGTLDLPSVRKGRFDEAVGIYPPDPLSRAGHIAYLCSAHAASPWRKWDTAKIHAGRYSEVVARTGGLGMTALTSAGWFRPNDRSNLDAMPIGYIYQRCGELPVMPELEATFDRVCPKGEGAFANREYMQWGWLTEWEEHCAPFRLKVPEDTLKMEELPKQWNQHLDWPYGDDGSGTAARRLAIRLGEILKPKATPSGDNGVQSTTAHAQDKTSTGIAGDGETTVP
jgi:hypothetical protein